MGQRMVWIEEDLASKLEIVNDVAKLKTDGDLAKVIKRMEDEIDGMAECLDENVLRFKLHAQQTRDSYEKTVQEEVDKSYELWEKCEDLRSKAKKKIDAMLPDIKTVSEELRRLNESMDKISTYRIDKLFELINKFNNMSEEDKNVLVKLLNYEKM